MGGDECELVVAIGKGGRDLRESDALDHIYGYAVGLDMTRRNVMLGHIDCLSDIEITVC